MEIDIKKIAKLVKLQLTPAEEEKYKNELSELLDHFTMLQEVDTTNVTMTCQSTGLIGQEREDRAIYTGIHAKQENILKCSSHKEGSFIKVPPVF